MINKKDIERKLARVYRHKITISKNKVTVSESGFTAEEKIPIFNVWASVSQLHGREFFQAAAIQAEHTVKFTVRYFKSLDEIDTSMTILFKGKNYNIVAIDNIKHADEVIEIKAVEVSASGNGSQRT